MISLGLETEIIDRKVYENTIERFRSEKILLPTFSQLADPTTIPEKIWDHLKSVDPDAPDPANLFRVHWYNARDRRSRAEVPPYVVLPEALTGVRSPIIVALGAFFPMIECHKVLAAYGCLAPRVITGQYDPTRHRAIWPSTGNYCRGGVAISRIMACRGVAILPEEMSQERFSWLERWVKDKGDIFRTPGCESNVKEIYDKCNELALEEDNVIFNQFCEFGNTLIHYLCTGRALEHVFETVRQENPALSLRGFVSATGSAGTIATGDYLKEKYGAAIVAAEALECPTLLNNGFGGHNIQGIGDKHVPLIHNVMNSDFVVAVSDQDTDSLDLLFNSDTGRDYLTKRRGLSPELVDELSLLGFSSICNVIGAIKTAKYLDLGPDDAMITVATDSAAMYNTERDSYLAENFGGSFDQVNAGETFARFLLGTGTDNMSELTHVDRDRIFNLGYYTWVEQQGVTLEQFEERRQPEYWLELRNLIPAWDEMIQKFNQETGVELGK